MHQKLTRWFAIVANISAVHWSRTFKEIKQNTHNAQTYTQNLKQGTLCYSELKKKSTVSLIKSALEKYRDFVEIIS